jgi:hypothetical protein
MGDLMQPRCVTEAVRPPMAAMIARVSRRSEGLASLLLYDRHAASLSHRKRRVALCTQ